MPTRPHVRHLALTAAILMLVSVSCERGGRERRTGQGAVRPTPAPPFRSLVSAPLTDVLAYAAGLEWDTTRSPGDERQLFDGTGPRRLIGPFARVQREIGAGALPSGALQQGRIVARITKRGPAFPPLGLSDDTTYVGIQEEEGRLHMLMFPGDRNGPSHASTGQVVDFLTCGLHHPTVPNPHPHFEVTPDSSASFKCYDDGHGNHIGAPCRSAADSVRLDSLLHVIYTQRSRVRRDSLRRDSAHRDSLPRPR